MIVIIKTHISIIFNSDSTFDFIKDKIIILFSYTSCISLQILV